MNGKRFKNIIFLAALFISLLVVTGCAEKCTVSNCGNDVVEGFDFCEEHLCAAKDCKSETVDEKKYCANHLCSAKNCENQKTDGEQYCEDHICKKEDCHNYAVGYCDDCAKTICTVSSCEEDRVKGAEYCKAHKCKVKACKKKAERKDFCDTHFDEKLKSALAKLNKDYDSVEDLTWYMPTCVPQYINSSSSFYPYLGKQGKNYWLRWKGVYVGTDWVFFDNIVLNVDGQQYTKSFNSSDIVRDNQYGDVWEVFDVNPSESDIKLLKAISKSKKTVIRYKGDDKQEDRTITAAQKQGIKDVLAVWELVQ